MASGAGIRSAGEVPELPVVESGLPSKAPAPKRLSEEMRELALAYEHQDFWMRELMERLAGRVYTLMLVLLSLPFCQPIALPGLSMPFGLVIALLGLRFAFRQKPWLPKLLQDTRIPAKFLPMLLRMGSRIVMLIEKLMHPRLSWIFEFHATQFACGLIIAACGSLLLLPLPIPFSNLLPSLTVILVAASFSERDGAMLGAGVVSFVLTVLFFCLLFWGGTEVAGWLEQQFDGLFDPGNEDPLRLLPLPEPLQEGQVP
jgi:hypothetical protein